MSKQLSLITALVLIATSLSLFGCKSPNGEKMHCVLSIEYEKGCVFGSVTYYNFLHFVNDDGLTLNLYPNKFSQKSGAITPLTALLNEKEVSFELDGEQGEYLVIDQNFSKEDSLQILFKTAIEGADARLKEGEGVVNLSYFYPHVCEIDGDGAVKYPYVPFGDPFFDVIADYEVHFTVASTLSVACGLSPLFVEVLGEKTRYGYELKNARTVAFCVSEKFMVASKKWGYTRVNYYYYDDNEPEKRLEKIIEHLAFFSKKIGAYPFADFTVAQTDCLDGGMEYPAFCMVGRAVDENEFDYCILHEVAHQWFGIGVDFNQFTNSWLDEGLAECLSMLYLKGKDKKQYDERLFYAKGLSSAFDKGVSRGVFGYREGVFRTLDEFGSKYEYVVCAYKKPMVALLSICEELGEGAFFNGLGRVYGRFLTKRADVNDFCKSFKINRSRVQKCLPKGA